jgi:hypothetical protein
VGSRIIFWMTFWDSSYEAEGALTMSELFPSQGQIMAQLFIRAAARGMVILLDMHTLESSGPVPPELWYDARHTYADFQVRLRPLSPGRSKDIAEGLVP